MKKTLSEKIEGILTNPKFFVVTCFSVLIGFGISLTSEYSFNHGFYKPGVLFDDIAPMWIGAYVAAIPMILLHAVREAGRRKSGIHWLRGSVRFAIGALASSYMIGFEFSGNWYILGVWFGNLALLFGIIFDPVRNWIKDEPLSYLGQNAGYDRAFKGLGGLLVWMIEGLLFAATVYLIIRYYYTW
jgi:hypothetical protein